MNEIQLAALSVVDAMVKGKYTGELDYTIGQWKGDLLIKRLFHGKAESDRNDKPDNKAE